MGKKPGRNGAVRELRTVPCCTSSDTAYTLTILWEKTLGVTERYGSFVPYRLNRGLVLNVERPCMGKNRGRNGAVRELRTVPIK